MIQPKKTRPAIPRPPIAKPLNQRQVVNNANFDSAMAQQTYNSLLAQSIAQAMAFRNYLGQGMNPNDALTWATGGTGPMPQAMPTPITQGTTQPAQSAGSMYQAYDALQKYTYSPNVPPAQNFPASQTFGSVNPQAFQNFQNLFNQGVAQSNARNPSQIPTSIPKFNFPTTQQQRPLG